jgi:hypothetical protein
MQAALRNAMPNIGWKNDAPMRSGVGLIITVNPEQRPAMSAVSVRNEFHDVGTETMVALFFRYRVMVRMVVIGLPDPVPTPWYGSDSLNVLSRRVVLAVAQA